MNRKFRILLDMDDVITSTNLEFASYYFRKHGVLFPIGNITDWSFWPDKSIYTEIFEQPDFMNRMKPKKDAVEVIREFIEEGDVDIFIVTHCLSVQSFQVKLDWIAKYMPFFPLERVVSIREKSAIWGDVLLDDAPHNILEWESVGEPVIYNTSYNQHLPKRFRRVNSFREFKDYVDQKRDRKRALS